MAAPVPRRLVAIKHGDGEPLTRADIQYDVLHAIFADTHEVFTNPFASKDAPKMSFKDLYIKSILHSPKATKALKDKMNESEEFSEDYAMLSLLVNVGRINTTMSCESLSSSLHVSFPLIYGLQVFPEMKTAIRTYHPVPSLQRTGENLQDAPRIKHVLRAIRLDDIGELKLGYPGSPAEIVARYVSIHTSFHKHPLNICAHIANRHASSHEYSQLDFCAGLSFDGMFIRQSKLAMTLTCVHIARWRVAF